MQPRTATAQKCKQTLQNEFSNNNRQTRSPFIVRKKKSERKRSEAKKHALSQITKPGRGQVRCCAIWMKLKKKHTQKIRSRVKKRNRAKTRGEKIITNEKCKKKCMPSVHFRLLCTYSFCRTMWGCFAFLSACSCWGWSPLGFTISTCLLWNEISNVTTQKVLFKIGKPSDYLIVYNFDEDLLHC